MSTPTPRPARRGYFLPGFIALAALLTLGVAFGAGDLEHPAARTLVGPEIASQIALGIQTEENAAAAPAVHCPGSEPVRQGLVFDCTDGSGPSDRTVYVTEIDGRGDVRWSFSPQTAPST